VKWGLAFVRVRRTDLGAIVQMTLGHY